MKTYVLLAEKKLSKTESFKGLFFSYIIDAESLNQAKEKFLEYLESKYWGKGKYSIDDIFEEKLPDYKKRIHCDVCGEFNLVVWIDEKTGKIKDWEKTTCDFCQFEKTIVKIGQFTKNKVKWEIYEYTEEAKKHELFSGEVWVRRMDRPDDYFRATDLAYTLISEMKEPSYSKLPKALQEVL